MAELSDMAALVGLLKPIVKVSFNSSIVSCTIAIEIVFETSFGAKLKVPDFET